MPCSREVERSEGALFPPVGTRRTCPGWIRFGFLIMFRLALKISCQGTLPLVTFRAMLDKVSPFTTV